MLKGILIAYFDNEPKTKHQKILFFQTNISTTG